MTIGSNTKATLSTWTIFTPAPLSSRISPALVLQLVAQPERIAEASPCSHLRKLAEGSLQQEGRSLAPEVERQKRRANVEHLS